MIKLFTNAAIVKLKVNLSKRLEIHDELVSGLRLGVSPKRSKEQEVLYPLLLKYGKLEYIRSDYGSEFIAGALQVWLTKVGIKPIQIYPGSPWESGYNERLNGMLRHEVLNAE